MVCHIRAMSERGATLLLLLLLGTDVAFVILHVISALSVQSRELCSTAGICASLASYQLIKLFWISVLFVIVVKATRRLEYATWIVVFLYLFLDKALQIHRTIGSAIANSFDRYLVNSSLLQPRSLEIAVLAVTAAMLSGIVLLAYRCSSEAFKQASYDLLLLIMIWAFFGLFSDFAAAVTAAPLAEISADIIEDGGEMVAVSLIVWYVFLLAIRRGECSLHLRDLLSYSRSGKSTPV